MTISTQHSGFNKIPNRLAVVESSSSSSSSSLVLALEALFVYVSVCAAS